MTRKLAVALLACMVAFSCICLVSADYSVGVKSGDWIEYAVSYTGSPTQGHDVTWARMQINSVSGSAISISITSRFSDGSSEVTNSTLNLQTGHLIDGFIIPADLNVGDSFPDENNGNLTITNSKTQVYAAASRTVLSASAGNNSYVWDQATGVSVEGTSQTAAYSIHTVAQATNMWTPPQGVSLATWVLLAAVLVVITALVLAFTAWYLRMKACQRRSGGS
jgi:hypothetical protein